MKFRYIPALDGLRGVAVLAVMGFHFEKAHVGGGMLGVDIFFVLSGYLITSLLLTENEQEGQIDYLAFWGRRARRLLPALAILLAVYAALCPFLFPHLVSRMWFDIAGTAFYVTNLRETFRPFDMPLSHTWSLAIEEQFYLAWPFVITALTRCQRQKAGKILGVTWASLTVLRITWMVVEPGTAAAYYFTPFHATGLIAGSWLAFRSIKLKVGLLAFAGLVALIVMPFVEGTFIATQPVGEILVAFVVADAPRLLSIAPLRFVGRISYSTYLWHIPVMWVLFHAYGIWNVPAMIILALCLGTASTLLVEEPLRRMIQVCNQDKILPAQTEPFLVPPPTTRPMLE